MKKNLFFIGLDISEADFAASIYKTPGQLQSLEGSDWNR